MKRKYGNMNIKELIDMKELNERIDRYRE